MWQWCAVLLGTLIAHGLDQFGDTILRKRYGTAAHSFGMARHVLTVFSWQAVECHTNEVTVHSALHLKDAAPDLQ